MIYLLESGMEWGKNRTGRHKIHIKIILSDPDIYLHVNEEKKERKGGEE